MVLTAATTEDDVHKVREMGERAEKSCMISNALRGNVELAVETTITINEGLGNNKNHKNLEGKYNEMEI